MYPNKVDEFTEKLNKLDNNTYTIEEEVSILKGIYEGELKHDNISKSSVRVYTGSKLTGTKVENFILSTPSKTPWKTEIKIFSKADKVYITYQTQGDTVEAEDINKVQESITNTQKALNNETNRAKNEETNICNNLDIEVKRVKGIENTLTNDIDNTNSNLNNEVNRAKEVEESLSNSIDTTHDNLNSEINRAKDTENTITENLNTEARRAKSVESTLTNNINNEIDRAKAKENSIESNLNNYKESNNVEVQKLKEKDSELDRKKANKTYVDTELNKRYLKEETFTKEEVSRKIQDVIGTAPEALDTLQEIAKSLNNDEDFAGTMTNELSKKVNKVPGKDLTDENYTLKEKQKLAGIESEANKYIHPSTHSANIIVENSNKRFVSDSEKAKWNAKAGKGPFTWNDLKGV